MRQPQTAIRSNQPVTRSPLSQNLAQTSYEPNQTLSPATTHLLLNERRLATAQRVSLVQNLGLRYGNQQVQRMIGLRKPASVITAAPLTAAFHTVQRACACGAAKPDQEDAECTDCRSKAGGIQRTTALPLLPGIIQRAQIDYQQVSWSDFSGAVPGGSSFDALTSSGLKNYKGLKLTKTQDEGDACKIGKKDATEFTANVGIDPASFDDVKAYMEQGKSWGKTKFKDGGKATTDKEVKACQKEFDATDKQLAKECKDSRKEQISDCNTALKGKSPDPWTSADDVTVTEKKNCTTAIVDACKAGATVSAYELKSEDGTTVATAANKAACDADFQEAAAADNKVGSDRLLKHEQGHFDVSNVMAGKLKQAQLDLAATLSASETKCGKTAATTAANASFTKLNATKQLNALNTEAGKQLKQAQKDYDDDSDHGQKADQQAAWEAKIAGGLDAYPVS